VSHATGLGIPRRLLVHKRRLINGHKFSTTDVKIDRVVNLLKDPREHATINNVEAMEIYGKDTKCYESVPVPIDPNVTWRIIGVNVNGLRPYGDMAALIIVAKILRALQADIIAFLETNVQWHKFQLRDNM
jgi:hypothetical protein